jgi:hypothetical protein
MVGIVDAYITWQHDIRENGLDGVPMPVPLDLRQGILRIQVVDVFCKFPFVLLLVLR